jgi:ribonuclease HII
MRLVVGVDEVGFGSIAGPLVVCAAAFNSITLPPILKWTDKRGREKPIPVQDSKNLRHEVLPEFCKVIRQYAEGAALVSCSPQEIDDMGVGPCRLWAIKVAVHRLFERVAFVGAFDPKSYRVYVDGDLNLGDCDFEYIAQPKADQTIWQVSAASILAKDTQISAMLALHDNPRYKAYAWDSNKGYPTAAHVKALKTRGVTKHHRRSYRTVKECLA